MWVMRKERHDSASMKGPPKVKGNVSRPFRGPACPSLNEGPSESEGQRDLGMPLVHGHTRLNEGPSESEGQLELGAEQGSGRGASMKGPPKVKGNGDSWAFGSRPIRRLNEGPSESEGQPSGNPAGWSASSLPQ